MLGNNSQPSRHRTQIDSRDGRGGRTIGFAGEGRALSEVLGGILMFGLLIGLLVLVQVNAVPAQNEQVEFEHNERVQQDLLELNDELLRTGSENVPGSAQIELSARYPARFFLLNPPAGAGAVRTTESETITVSNVVAPNVDHYWDGGDKTFPTRTIEYRPNYNEYDSAPVTKYEHNTLVNSFESGAVAVDDSTFIDGDQITVVTVDGELSRGTAEAIALETTPLSGPMQSVTVENAQGQDLVLSLPTTLTESDWDTLLEDELVANGGHVTDVQVNSGTPFNTLEVTLEDGTYDLRMSRVGVSSNIDESVLGAHYIAAVSNQQLGTVRHGERLAVTAQVRDRFNNPSSGEVTFSTVSSGSGTFIGPGGTGTSSYTVDTDENGEATALFRPNPTVTGDAVITASGDFDGNNNIETREYVEFSTTIEPATNQPQNSSNNVSSINPAFLGESVELRSVDLIDKDTLELTFVNLRDTDQNVKRIRGLFYISDDTVQREPQSWLVYENTTANPTSYERKDEFTFTKDWTKVTKMPTVTVEAGSPGQGEGPPETIRLDLDTAGPQGHVRGDFFGISIRFTDTTGTYFIQVPQN